MPVYGDLVSYFYVNDTQAWLLIVKRLRAVYTMSGAVGPSALRPQFWLKFLCRIIKPTGRTNDYTVVFPQLVSYNPNPFIVWESDTMRPASSVAFYLAATQCIRNYSSPTMTKWLCLPDKFTDWRECTQCGASSWLIWDSWQEYDHGTSFGCFCSRFRSRFRSRVSMFSSCPWLCAVSFW